jgi:hypothetical protein
MDVQSPPIVRVLRGQFTNLFKRARVFAFPALLCRIFLRNSSSSVAFCYFLHSWKSGMKTAYIWSIENVMVGGLKWTKF